MSLSKREFENQQTTLAGVETALRAAETQASGHADDLEWDDADDPDADERNW